MNNLIADHIFFSRSTSIPSLDACLCHDGHPEAALQPGDVVEIQGPPASGKTHLVYQIMISCVLPQSTRYSGWGKAAVVYDTDGTFQLSRLKELLHARLSGSHGIAEDQASSSTIDELEVGCLGRIFVFRPTSSAQLAAAILTLGDVHANNARLAHQEIGLVVVDSLSSFYWQDRFTVEQFQAGSSAHHIKSPIQHVLTALEGIRTSHRPIIVFTNWGLNPVGKSSLHTGKPTSPFFKQHLHALPRLSSPFNHDANPRMSSDDSHMVAPLEQPPDNHRNTDHGAGFTGLPLMHHITLQSSSTLPEDAPIPATDDDQGVASPSDHARTIEGFVRSSGSTGQIKTFTFQIHTS